MTRTVSDFPSPKALTVWRWLPSVAIICYLLLNALALQIPDDKLIEGQRVFYWQRYNYYLHQLQCLTVVLIPIALVIGGTFLFRLPRRSWPSLPLIMAVFLFGAGMNYGWLFISDWVRTVDTVHFNGQVYHLTAYGKYDDPTRYYLGKCDKTGYWCVFNQIYHTFLMEPGPPQMNLDNDAEMIIVKMGTETVYTNDGEKGHCIEDVLLVWCSR